MTLRADLQQVIDDVDAADRTAEALNGRLTDAQFAWHEPGRWSVAKCLDHLATMNEVYSAAIATGVEKAERNGWAGGGPIAPSFFGAKFIQSMEPPVKHRGRSPAAARPVSTAPRADIMRAYFQAHEKFRNLVRRCAAIDVNRATYMNPFLRVVPMRVGTGLRIIPAHDRRHLWQADQVTKADGFPR
jgi:hypothetical protein